MGILADYEQAVLKFQGECNCIVPDDRQSDGDFSIDGCDIHHEGSHLGTVVFPVQGYNPATNEVEPLGTICEQCLQFVVNGELPDFVEGE